MVELPTISEIKRDEQALRRAITAALTPGPWKHDYPGHPRDSAWACNKCGKNKCENSIEHRPYCPIPNAFTGPLEVALHRLIAKIDAPRTAMSQIEAVSYAAGARVSWADWLGMFHWWLSQPIVDPIICCLLALRQAREDEK